MRKICALFIAAIIAASDTVAFSYSDIPVNFLINGNSVNFSFSPMIRDGVTYVDLKTLSSKLGLSYKTYPGHESVVISNALTSICFIPGEMYATVSDMTGKSDSEYFYRLLTSPCIYVGNHLAVAARDISQVFGYPLSFDQASNTVHFGFSPEMLSEATRANISSRSYYFQNQTEFALPSFGSGYCWVCSYAMVITNTTGRRITPADVAAVNLTKTTNGAYCYHSEIVSAFGVKFVSALSESSPYYAGRVSGSGGTLINNPQRDDRVVRAAIKEALTLHPEGVMVRYADFPHTMVAVAYQDDMILFNDPAPSGSGAYSDSGRYQGVPFSETCVAAKGFALSDITFIQALDLKGM